MDIGFSLTTDITNEGSNINQVESDSHRSSYLAQSHEINASGEACIPLSHVALDALSLSLSHSTPPTVYRPHRPKAFNLFQARVTLANTHGFEGLSSLEIIFQAIQFKTQFQMDNVNLKYDFIIQ
jgi:hypothetical protein